MEHGMLVGQAQGIAEGGKEAEEEDDDDDDEVEEEEEDNDADEDQGCGVMAPCVLEIGV